MGSFLVTLSPLEPYFFGGERNFDFGQVRRKMKQSYFIRSQETPAQTTLLGALRYAVLYANDALIRNFTDAAQKKHAADLVGPKSFSFGERSDFGWIHSISPLFILEDSHYLVPAPMNHKESGKAKRYTPMKIERCEDVLSSVEDGLIAVDYDAKAGCTAGWVNVDSGEMIPPSDLFEGVVRLGIDTHRAEREEEGGYFKKEYKRLKRGSFAFFAEMEKVPERLLDGVTVFLGQNKSAFLLRMQAHQNDLADLVQQMLESRMDMPFWYALGDCLMNNSPSGFHIVRTRLFRHLTTSADNRYYHRYNKTEKLYRLVEGGSVFYGSEPEGADEAICNKIGMNHFIYVGGGKHED